MLNLFTQNINRNLVKELVISSIIIACSVFTATVYADPAKGLEIAKQRKTKDLGWQDSTATMEMLLKNAYGETSTRLMRMQSLEVENDGDKGLTIFDEPLDVKGTAFLNYSHVTGSDDQWLYLPALKRVKRISSRNKSGPFMGSEFAYEDLSSFEIEKYQFDYLKDDVIEGTPAYVVQQIPVDKNSGYTKQLVWVDQAEYRPLKTEFYDRKGSLLKTLTFSDYKKYLTKYWRAHTMEMVNHQTGNSTILNTWKLAFRTGLQEKDFHKNILKRVK